MNPRRFKWFLASVAAIILSLSVELARATWNVKRHANATGHGCYLESDPVVVNDGYQDIRAFVRLGEGEIGVVTESPLDGSFDDIGIVVDRRAFVQVETIRDRKEALFKAAYPDLLQQFRKGSRVAARLRFWPTWPATGTHTASFTLIGFSKAHAEMQACAK